MACNWLPKFGNSVETAIVQFSIRTLLRSRQHRVVLAFYLGIGFACTIFFLKSPVARQISSPSTADPWHQPGMPLLAVSILLMGFCVLGIRVVFSLPLDLRANWIFRIAPLQAGAECLVARRRSLLVLSVLPLWLGSAALFLSIWPWRAALGHLVVLALLGVILSELCLAGAQKIPFTCSWLPGKSNFHITFWMCTALVVQIIGRAAEYEGALSTIAPATSRYSPFLLSWRFAPDCARSPKTRRSRSKKSPPGSWSRWNCPARGLDSLPFPFYT